MQLYLIRHPLPDVSLDVCYGRLDVGLADPVDQALARLHRHLPQGVPVYSSALQRCRSLAEGLSAEQGKTPIFDDRLMEMSFGAWEKQRWDAIDRTSLDAWAADMLNYVPPGGESAAQVLQRAQSFIGDVVTKNKDAIVVTHGGILRVLMANWLGLPPSHWRRLSFEFGGVSKVVLDDQATDSARIAFINR